jgi:hypothetical protein
VKSPSLAPPPLEADGLEATATVRNEELAWRIREQQEEPRPSVLPRRPSLPATSREPYGYD